MYDYSRLRLACYLIVLIAISINISACATGSTKTVTANTVQLESNEKVAIILHPWNDLFFNVKNYRITKKQYKTIKCFKESLESKIGDIDFVDIELSRSEYVDENCKFNRVFTKDKILDVGVIKCLQVYQERISPLKIKILVLLSISYYAETVSNGKWYEIDCGAGYGIVPVACGGLDIWKNKTKMRAIIVDLEKEEILGEFVSKYESKSWLLCIGIPLLGSPDVSDTKSCKRLGESVAKFLIIK